MKNNIHISQSFKMLYMNPLFVIYLQHSQENERIFNFSVFDGVAWENLSCHTCVWVRGHRWVAASFILLYVGSKDGIQVTKLIRQVPLPHRPMTRFLLSSGSKKLETLSISSSKNLQCFCLWEFRILKQKVSKWRDNVSLVFFGWL